MSALLSLKQNTVGQFTCSMRGRHSISTEDEDKLYKTDDNMLQTTCNMCGVTVVAKIEPKHENIYTISRMPEH